ncbi:MAG: FtsX-like permease family protein [Nitrososphaerota archaeon]|nr:FtsX-like permease family protein [Candidatus Calditenuaceae archaeon]MDW8073200.1 FtsX-like permease family protein [Nitrososphaerota archaeon]
MVEERKYGRVSFPATELLRLVSLNIRKRFSRTLLTMLSVLLAIAFMTVILTLSAVNRAAAGTEFAAYQFWLIFVALLVAGLGVFNSLLISVAERYREIATIKTLGAADRHILLLYLIESLIIGIIGGALGVLIGSGLGVGLLVAYGRASDIMLVPVTEYLSIMGQGLMYAALLSLIATSYPSYHASKMSAAEAFRVEI